MTEEAALLAAIVAHPADDTPRLVYADWLDEHGRPEQAAFIRIQCQYSATAADHPNFIDVLAREAELQLWLATHAPGPNLRLSAGLKVQGGPTWWKSSFRGFPRFFEFDAHPDQPPRSMRSLAAALEKAFTRLPTRWLVVRQLTLPQLAELLRQPILAATDLLSIYCTLGEGEADEAMRHVADSPHLRNLRGLYLGVTPSETGCAAMAASNFVRLEGFNVDAERIAPAAVRILGRATWFRGLGELRLTRDLSSEAFQELCESGPYPHLYGLSLPDSAFELHAWQAFARSTAFPRLAWLKHNGDLSGGRMAAVTAGTQFQPHTLEFDGCAIGNDGAEALAAAPWAGSLRRLDLATNNLGASGVAAIGAGPFGNLRHLDLRGNTPGVGGLRAIAKNPTLRRLAALMLGNVSDPVRTPTTHIENFLAKLDLPELRHLDLGGLHVRSAGANVLATEPKFRSLTRLGLDSCHIGDAGAAALVRSPHLQELIELRLSNNDIRSGVEPLTDPAVMPRLASCQLDGNAIPAKLAARLKRRRGVHF